MMEESLKNEVLRLIKLRRTTKNDVNSMINIIRTYIDERINVCSHCPAQIRYAQNQLLNWYNLLQVEEPIQKEEVKEVGCTKCKKKVGRPKKNQ